MAQTNFMITPKFSTAEWRALSLPKDGSDAGDWEIAAEILRSRLYGRFINPATKLIRLEEKKRFATYGFSVLALDCLCIETIQGFKNGETDHNGKSKVLFVEFLRGWSDFWLCVPSAHRVDHTAKLVFGKLRCALLHAGSTDDLTVDRTKALAVFAGDKLQHINRNKFHFSLRDELNSYLSLLSAPGSRALKANMKKKMDAICT